jgi:hypothetical protein
MTWCTNRLFKILSTGIVFGMAAAILGVAIGLLNSILSGYDLRHVSISALASIDLKGGAFVSVAVIIFMLIGTPRARSSH